MKTDQLTSLIDSLVAGEISTDDHALLQATLKTDAAARKTFRERIDLEAALRTWANETPEPILATGHKPAGSTTQHESRPAAPSPAQYIAIVVALAMIFMLLLTPWMWSSLNNEDPDQQADVPRAAPQFVGSLRQQDCQWDVASSLTTDRFAPGTYTLTAGVAEFRFDSGTDVVIEAPCNFVVESSDSAKLLAGNLFVNVTEVSNGFTLTTPEARILDEGTSYAVALNDRSTEVHVFDGSVIWIPELDAMETEDRIEAGQAKSFLRSQPATARHVPFGQRQFVRKLEADIQRQAGGKLLAYDGFENIAGRMRRGRSGFGWAGGWQSSGRARGKLGSIIDAPTDTVFGQSRSGRRLLLLQSGDDIRRDFAQPFDRQPSSTYYISFLLERLPSDAHAETSLQIVLEPTTTSRQRSLRGNRDVISFGITTEGFPYINSGNTITKTALRLRGNEVHLCVIKVARGSGGDVASMRLYQLDEPVGTSEPTTWTVSGLQSQTSGPLKGIRIAAGRNAAWQVDELRFGTSWNSVTNVSSLAGATN